MTQLRQAEVVHAHPALTAWRSLEPACAEPDGILPLKGKSNSHRKSSVFRLFRGGSDGYAVIAKRCRRATAASERVVYTEVLPQLPIPTLHYYGIVENTEDDDSWLFLEDAGDVRYLEESEQHRRLAAEWLAFLHGFGASMSLVDQLPTQGPDQWLVQLHASRDTISRSLCRPLITSDERRALGLLLTQFEEVERFWNLIVRVCGDMPQTVVHGDFVAKNMSVRQIGTRLALLPYDWECVSWGVPAADLTHHSTHSPFPDLHTYWMVARQFWPQLSVQHVQLLSRVGRIVRLLSGIGWACESLRGERTRSWLEKPLQQLKAYEESLREAVFDLHRNDACPTRLTRYPEVDQLAIGLSFAFKNQDAPVAVEVVSRTTNNGQSSFPSEIVTCRLDSALTRTLFCKYGTGYVRHSFGHKGGVAYEAEVYRKLLGPLGLSVPRLMGVYAEPTTGVVWLFLEFLRDCRVVSKKVPSSWPLAARWIATFHASTVEPVSQYPFLYVYDHAYYLGWVDRAFRFSAQLRREYPWLRVLCDRGEKIAGLFCSIPRTLIHGEYYYKNILVQDGLIRPIDWESTAVAFGEIDLVALVDGGWPPDIVQECERQYKQARWQDVAPADFDRRLDVARLYLNFRWLGNHPRWTAGKKGRRRFEAMREAAERLGLL